MGDRLAREGEGLGDLRDRVGVGGEPAPHPVGGELGGVGVRVPRQPAGDLGVEVVELPEAGRQQQRPRPGAPRTAVLGPRPDPLDVRVGGEEAAQRELVEHAEVVGDRPERLELASALQLDDAPLGALLERLVEREPGVEVAEAVLRRHHQPRGVDAREHLVVRLGVGVHVTHRTDADAPGPEDDVLVGALRLTGEGVEHRPDGGRRGHRDLGEVVDARGVVDRPALADAEHDPGQLRELGVELVERRLVDVPQPGVGRVEVEPLGEVALQRGAEHEHVGAEVDVEAQLVELGPQRAERVPHRFCPGDVLRVVGVDLRHLREGDVLQEAGHGDGVVALRQHVLGEVAEAVAGVGEGRLVDPRRLGQQDVLERAGVVGVVGAAAPLLGVGVDPRRAEVDHPERQPGGHRLAEPLGERPVRPRGLGEVVDAPDRPGLGRRTDPQPVGGARQAVGVVVIIAVAEADPQGRRPLAVGGRVAQLGPRGVEAYAVGCRDAHAWGSDGLPRRCRAQHLGRHVLGLDPDAQRARDAVRRRRAQRAEHEEGEDDLEPPLHHERTLVRSTGHFLALDRADRAVPRDRCARKCPVTSLSARKCPVGNDL